MYYNIANAIYYALFGIFEKQALRVNNIIKSFQVKKKQTLMIKKKINLCLTVHFRKGKTKHTFTRTLESNWCTVETIVVFFDDADPIGSYRSLALPTVILAVV